MPARLRQRRERLALVLGVLGLWASVSANAAEPEQESPERVGPLLIAGGGRYTVRGGRPD
jgi:hypothetical protein